MGGDALVIPAQYGEEAYLTKLYCYNGFLYELFAPEGIVLSPQDGEALLPLCALHISSISQDESCEYLECVCISARAILLHIIFIPCLKY